MNANYVKLWTVIALLSFYVLAPAQLSMFKNGHWTVGGGLSFNRFDGDLKSSIPQTLSSAFTSPGGLVEAGFSFNHILTAGLGFDIAYVNQKDDNEYTWMIPQTVYPYVSVDLLAALKGKKDPKWSVNATLGVGIGAVLETFYINTSVYDVNNIPAVVDPSYISEDATGTKIRHYDAAYASLVGAGEIEYNLSKVKSIGLRLTLNKTNSDNLETMSRSSMNDYVESIGLTFKYKILDKNGNHASETANFVSADKECCNDLDAYRDQILQLQKRIDAMDKEGVEQNKRINELENRPVSQAKGDFTDSDGDGLADVMDKCPKEPGVLTNNGCPELDAFKLEGVHYKLNSSELLPAAFPILDNVAEVLKKHKDYQVIIGGHTSSEGAADYNVGLSQRRAESAKKYLVNKGIEASRLTPVGYGEYQPSLSNGTLEGRQKNRRVEFKLK